MKKLGFLEGIVKRHPDGFGFLIPDDTDHPDVYIPRHSMDGIMTNDRVLVEVEPEKGGQRFRGEIARVIKRSFTEIEGRFRLEANGDGVLLDEGHGWGSNLRIRREHTHNAKDGDYVRIQITSYPNQRDGFSGRVVEVIGKHGDPLLDVRKCIFTHKIPQTFSQACLQESETLPKEIPQKDCEGRKDLTHLPFITIDGATAKDFDDAIYTEQSSGGFKCWVAIADVSHYVKPGRPMDKDAYERGNSTYFPNYVVPMLPEALSNELCSLKPNVIRLALVAEMDVSFNGELTGSRFYEAFFRSQARVIYGEAQEVVDGNCPDKFKHVQQNILRSADLAKVLMARRTRNGSLQLEIGETQVVLDELGEPVDIIRAERVFAHKLIEELMLLANIAVAEFFHKNKIDAIYRIHEPPNSTSIELLNKYLIAFGSQKKLGGESLQKKITTILESFEGKPQEEIVNILTLRSMNQAVYSPDNVGHFGLGFAHYTHFTSPIRRYSDLIVHRLLKSLILKSDKYRQMNLGDLRSAGTHLSGCEQRSTKCERQFNSIKKARFIARHLGEEFDGVISQVTKFGVFVLLREFDVDGLIKIEDLGPERFDYDEEALVLIGRTTGMRYEIGMPLKVQVANADIDSGRVDFVLTDFVASQEKFEKRREEQRSEIKDKRHRKGQRETSQNRKADRPHFKKRGETEDDSRNVRKARVRKRRRAR